MATVLLVRHGRTTANATGLLAGRTPGVGLDDHGREQAARTADPRSDASRLGRQLNLPPAYLLIHRVTIGSIGVLCQLDAKGDYRGVVEEWLPGFVE